jgi:hypothetical protein
VGNITNEKFVEQLFEDTVERFGMPILLVYPGYNDAIQEVYQGVWIFFSMSVLFSQLSVNSDFVRFCRMLVSVHHRQPSRI